MDALTRVIQYADARAEWTRTFEEAHAKGLRFTPIRVDWTPEQIRQHTAELRSRIEAGDER